MTVTAAYPPPFLALSRLNNVIGWKLTSAMCLGYSRGLISDSYNQNEHNNWAFMILSSQKLRCGHWSPPWWRWVSCIWTALWVCLDTWIYSKYKERWQDLVLILNFKIRIARNSLFFSTQMCMKILSASKLFVATVFFPNFHIHIVILFSHFIPLLFSLDGLCGIFGDRLLQWNFQELC